MEFKKETIIKDVMFGPLNKGKSVEEARRIAKEALDFHGMGEEYYYRTIEYYHDSHATTYA